MYQLTENPDFVKCLETGAFVGPYVWMRDEYQKWLDEGNTPLPYRPYELYTPAHFQFIRTKAWEWMAEVVRARRYDSIETCVGYYNSGVERYRREARAMVAWRDAINQKLEELVVTRPDGIETWEQVKPLLPQPEVYDWPAPQDLPLDAVPPIDLPLE